MNCAGIICEYNPFHNGHKFLIDNVRQDINPDAVVCIMSGNFTQRGEPALTDKYTRAKMAVLGGADLVIELPVISSVNSASEFAKGGIGLLKKLGCINTVAFGSESGNIKVLNNISNIGLEEDESFSLMIRKYLDEGISYPKAYQSALSSLYPEYNEESISGSNNILGIEYIRQARKQNFHPDFYTVKRHGANHNKLYSSDGIGSGKLIRTQLFENKSDLYFVDEYLPKFSSDILRNGFMWNQSCDDRLFAVIRSCIINRSQEEISSILEVSEGLENRLKSAVIQSKNTDELIKLSKSKRYTYSRISRILTQLLLGITKEEYIQCDIENNCCLRALAFNNTGRSLIKNLSDNGVPVYTNIKKQLDDKTIFSGHLKFDMLASDYYSVITGNVIYDGSDYVCNSIYLNI